MLCKIDSIKKEGERAPNKQLELFPTNTRIVCIIKETMELLINGPI